MKKEQPVYPFIAVLAVLVLSVVFPAFFLREATGWAILAFLAPFGLLQIFGFWLILYSFAVLPGSKAPDA